AHAGAPRWLAGPRAGAAGEGRVPVLVPPVFRVASEALGGNVAGEDGRARRAPARTASPRIKRRRNPLRSLEALRKWLQHKKQGERKSLSPSRCLLWVRA